MTGLRTTYVAALCVLACVGLSTGEDAVVPSCDIDVYGVFDNSGSMDDNDDECLEYLRENVYDSSYTSKKACWEVINIYMKAAYSAVQEVCESANQGNPRISLTIFRCPGTGKDRKTLLLPTNNETLIEEAWVNLADQQMKGYSCAWGALDQVQYYINETKATTNAELGVPANVADPDANATRYPLVFIFTDGAIGNDHAAAEEIVQNLRSDDANTIVALNAFPNKQKIGAFANVSLIFGAEDLSTLDELSFRLGTYTISLDDITVCSDEQVTCVETVRSAIELERNASASCETMSQLYTALASCASAGCTGIDLTAEKDQCLSDIAAQEGSEECEPSKACRDLALHVNAQSYEYQSAPGAGFETSSATPSFSSRNANAQDDIALGDGSLEVSFEVSEGLGGGRSAPILGNSGNIIVGSVAQTDGTAGSLISVDPESGEVAWVLEGASSTASFEAPAVVGAEGSDDIFVGSSDGYFYRVSESDGSVKQAWNLGARIRAAAAVPADADYVLVATDAVPGVSSAMLHKISTADDPATQDPPQAWRRPICSNETYDYVVGGVHIILDQAVITACRSGHVNRVSFLTGLTNWKTSLGGAFSGIPLYDDDAEVFYIPVFLSEESSVTSIVRVPYTGEDSLHANVTSEVDANLFMDASVGILYALNRQGLLTAINATDMSLDSDIQSLVFDDAQLSMFGMGPDSEGNLVLVSGNVIAMAPGGDFSALDTTELQSKVTSLPLLANDAIYLSTSDSPLIRLETSGAQSRRRVLAEEDGDDGDDDGSWPAGAIAATVVLGVIFVILSVALCVLMRRR
ncbi:Hypothetical Protein FCC1311_036882 [Hondaea fermentalgiana]|uniref:VWFA domain-containing protein n=1 Tax=Hondaea fermentalgiana TaxID=2315210 RepID=A0A2R5G8U7_9STRA|nr:Hypothetical Protein FCC1311_036882 [Hondaea fermentalgiana]|eukprot:GBG27467.1 Hypothetical Protein FCC1311_036882 [Hondaea fermentalgiana]